MKTWQLVTIDPSLRNLGIAAFEMQGAGVEKLLYVGAIHARYKSSSATAWFVHSNAMVKAVDHLIHAIIDVKKPFLIVTETQENWFGSKGAASKDAGSIQKLYFFTGALSQILQQEEGFRGIYGVGPSTWKGQVPKEVMMRRAKNWASLGSWTLTGLTHDAAEAFLLGKYVEMKLLNVGVYKKEAFSFTHLETTPLVPLNASTTSKNIEVVCNY